tara:strand:- start:1088 stop:1477 length:390 start_codon:yes stop_codon:yes gene_type:complete
MYNKILSQFLAVIHTIAFLSVIIPFISNDKVILQFYLYWLIFVYVGWLLFKDKCWLSIIENKVANNKKEEWALHLYIKKIFPNFKKKHTALFFYCLNYAALIVVTYKLDILDRGVLWVLCYEYFKTCVN